MERKLLQSAVALAWLALPLTALNYWRAWDRLPIRVAVHFDANWQPNGWTSREGARMLALGMTAFLLVVFTLAAYAARRMATSSLSQWALVAVFYVVLGFVYCVNNWIVERNLSGKQPTGRSELMDSRDLNGRTGEIRLPKLPQGLKPAILVAFSGAAKSRALSKRTLSKGSCRRSVEMHS
jgi:Protein of unknown function (DUF1648)